MWSTSSSGFWLGCSHPSGSTWQVACIVITAWISHLSTFLMLGISNSQWGPVFADFSALFSSSSRFTYRERSCLVSSANRWLKWSTRAENPEIISLQVLSLRSDQQTTALAQTPCSQDWRTQQLHIADYRNYSRKGRSYIIICSNASSSNTTETVGTACEKKHFPRPNGSITEEKKTQSWYSLEENNSKRLDQPVEGRLWHTLGVAALKRWHAGQLHRTASAAVQGSVGTPRCSSGRSLKEISTNTDVWTYCNSEAPMLWSPSVLKAPVLWSPCALKPQCSESPCALKPLCSEAPVFWKPLCSEAPVLWSPVFRKPLCSEAPVLWSPSVLKPLCSEAPVLWSPCALKPLCSEAPVFWKPLVLWSPSVLKPLCSEAPVLLKAPVLWSPSVLKPLCSEAPVLWSPSALKPQCSEAPVLWIPCALKPLCSETSVLWRPSTLCSDVAAVLHSVHGRTCALTYLANHSRPFAFFPAAQLSEASLLLLIKLLPVPQKRGRDQSGDLKPSSQRVLQCLQIFGM